jgi:membrane fusion protein (multidrug efflux system)
MRPLLFALTAIFLTACSERHEPVMRPPPVVRTLVVQPQTIPVVFEYVGMAQSSHLVEVRSRVEGYLEEIAFQEGTLVKKGSLLFMLDLRPFEASLENAKGDLARQEAVLWNARRTTERLRPLYEQNAASQRDLDNAIAQELAGEAAVQSAQAQVRQAELNLDYAIMRSPIDGLTSQSNLREGALITVGQRDPMTTVSIIDPIWVVFSVSDQAMLTGRREIEKEQLKLPPEDNFTVEVVLSDGSLFPAQGKIDFTDPSLDQSTGTMNVRAVFKNPDMILRPGQFARVKVLGATRPNVLLVPQTAVIQSTNGMFVYVVNKENKIEIRQIEPGEWYQDQWYVKVGLSTGDRVVVDGVNKIRPGETVTWTDETLKQPEKKA